MTTQVRKIGNSLGNIYLLLSFVKWNYKKAQN